MTEQNALDTAVIETGAQASTITISSEAEPALLAGKYKTPADLEKAYTELQSKLGQRVETEAEAPLEDAAAPNAEETTDGADAYEGYGETVGAALKTAGVDPTAANAEFVETGTLSEETFTKFSDAGFPRDMVEAYLRGVAAATDEAATITATQITQIKGAAGGDEGYAKLTGWMASALPVDEIATFNNTVTGTDFAASVAAVATMQARYTAEFGNEARLAGGKAPAPNAGYATESDWLADMAKPEYKKSQGFRDQVAAKLARSPSLMKVM